MGGENCVLTTEFGVFAHVVVGERLYVALGVALAPRHVRGGLATTLPLRDGFLKQLALLVIYREASDCWIRAGGCLWLVLTNEPGVIL